jgi:hypothetical protein
MPYDFGVSEIYPILSDKGTTKYLFLGSGIGCTTCMFSKAVLLSIGDTSLDEEFNYSIAYRWNDLYTFDYDTLSQVFHCSYLVDDLNQSENTLDGNGMDEEPGEEEEDVPPEKPDASVDSDDSVSISFVFDGEEFEQTDDACKGVYRHGKEEGKWVCMDEDSVTTISNYSEGRLNGQQVSYYPNGKMKSNWNFDHDKFHGFANHGMIMAK